MLVGIVSIHEFGHFLAAKAFGVYCYEFSIGMGPKLYTKKGKETNFSIRALPIGGFVAMAGDDDDNADVEKPDIEIPKERTLPGVSPIKRIIIMASGVIMNFLLALVVVACVFLSNGVTNEAPKAIINSVQEGYPAYKAGIQVGDEVIKASYENGYSISPKNFEELSTFLSIYDGKGNVTFKIVRDGEKLDIKMKPVYSQEEGRYLIGITSPGYTIVEVTYKNVLKYSVNYISEMLKFTFMTLIGLFRGVGFENVSGPIGIYQVTEEAVSYGFGSYFALIAIISLSIGAFNLVPLPIFDGGRILLTIIEMIIGRPIEKKTEQAIMTVSVFVILALVIFTTFKDIFNIFAK